MSLAVDNLELARYGHLPVDVIAELVAAGGSRQKVARMLKHLAETGLLPWVDRHKRPLAVLEARHLPWVAGKTFENPPPDALASATLTMTATVRDAWEAFEGVDQCWLPLVNARGQYTGLCASREKLHQLQRGLLRPPRVGGLATPLGVYMTSGYYASGAGLQGLIATGAMFGLIAPLLDVWAVLLYSGLSAVFPAVQHLNAGQQHLFHVGALFTSLLMLLRLTPIAGLHAAEHMTINALEQGLPLTEAVVRQQPREHNRCGTNLMVFLAGFELLCLSLYTLHRDVQPLALLLYGVMGGLLIWNTWKAGGLWLQRHFTTKAPTSAEIASGIRAGEELLARFQAAPHGRASLLKRIWGSGIPHMLAAFLLTAQLVGWLLERIGL